jgi:hypothetical protein
MVEVINQSKNTYFLQDDGKNIVLKPHTIVEISNGLFQKICNLRGIVTLNKYEQKEKTVVNPVSKDTVVKGNKPNRIRGASKKLEQTGSDVIVEENKDDNSDVQPDAPRF